MPSPAAESLDRLRQRKWLALVVILAGAGLFVLGSGLQGWAVAAGWVTLLLGAALFVRLSGAAWLGPVFVYDVLRTARRGRNSVLRSLYAFALLVVLFLVYADWFGGDLASLTEPASLPASQVARFAAAFFHTFLMVQYFAVLLVAPAYTAGAIAEEKVTGTLEYLLATDLSSREVILGKLLSRVANLVLLLLTGLPFLSLLQLLGGVDPNLVLVGFAGTLLTVVSIASLGIANSVHCDRPRDAVFLTYIEVVVYQLVSGFCCGPMVLGGLIGGGGLSALETLLSVFSAGNVFVLGMELEASGAAGTLESDLPSLLIRLVVFHGGVSVVCIGWAVHALRRRALVRDDRPREVEVVPVDPRKKLEERRQQLRHLGDRDPMLWKELYVERGIGLHPFARHLVDFFTVGGLFVSGMAFFCGILLSFGSDRLFEFSNYWVRFMVPLVAALGMLGLVLRGAGTMIGERERQTLDSLLTTQLGATDILRAKFVGCLWSVRVPGVILAAVLSLGVLTGGVSPLALPLLAAAVAAHAAFAINLGMFCSLKCGSSLRATVVAVVLLVLFTAGHWVLNLLSTVLLYLSGYPGVAQGLIEFHTFGLTPPATLIALIFPLEGDRVLFMPDAVPSALGGVVVYAALALFFRWRVRSHFHDQTGRMG